jgi:poly(3-hydroxybutyrate) depolymerase
MQKAFILVLFLFPLLSSAQRTPKMIEGPRGKIGFYQYLPPHYNEQPETKHPLIIFLHGIGEKGTGSEEDLKKLNCCGIPKYIDLGHTMEFTWNGKKEGFVVLYPQLYSRYGTWETYFIDAMIAYAKKNLNIDTNRIFLTGLSLGGGGTWVYASSSVSKAKQFAGIVPVVSPCFMTNGCNIANADLPVLAVHAMNDDKASPYCTINAIKSINDCGATAHPNIIIYENGGHYVWVHRAYDTAYHYYNPNVYEWMLAQNRLFKPNVKPVASAGKDITISSADGAAYLDASASKDPDGKVIRYIWQKISGPTVGSISGEITAKPLVSGLNFPGVYVYRVRVVDDRAEWSTATVKVTVVDGNVLN